MSTNTTDGYVKRQLDPFEKLLRPFDVYAFFRDTWNRMPLYVPGDTSKIDSLPGLESLPSLLGGHLAATHWSRGHAQNAQATFVDQSGRIKKISAPSMVWPELYNSGASLCFSAVDQCSEGLSTLVQGFAATTKLPGIIVTTCYLTPPRSGSPMHFDQQHSFLIQVSGRKHWRVSRQVGWENAPINMQSAALGTPGMKAFLRSIGVAISSPQEAELEEMTLNPGDVLYLPPGFWHHGSTSDSHSFHYTLTFTPLTPWTLLIAYLRQGYFEHSALRCDLRYSAISGEGSANECLEKAIVEFRRSLDALTAHDLESSFIEMASRGGLFKDHFAQA